MLIHTGNHECVTMRHRQSQTLFISKLMKPSDGRTPYIKIYISLFILAYTDAVNRAHQLESQSLSPQAQSLLRLRIDDMPALPNMSTSGLFERYPMEVEILPLDEVGRTLSLA